MNNQPKLAFLAAFALVSTGFSSAPSAAPAVTKKPMGFFITSVGLGNGANLGGLAGADRHCQTLAQAAGAGQRTWHAYLSTSATPDAAAVNARDRIGRGPWYNAKGDLIARNVDELHRSGNITKQTALSETGAVINGRGDKPNMHDILTGSDSHGRGFSTTQDTTCGNWTKSGEGSAQVGHHDRLGLSDKAHAKSWNHAHPSRGCSQEALRSSGGNGFFYCFAVK